MSIIQIKMCLRSMFSVSESTANIRRVTTTDSEKSSSFNVMCNPFGNEENRDSEPNIIIFEATETTEITILWGHFPLTVKFIFMPFMIWCFCRLYVSHTDHITSNSVGFRFGQRKKNVWQKFSRTRSRPFDYRYCIMCTVWLSTYVTIPICSKRTFKPM